METTEAASQPAAGAGDAQAPRPPVRRTPSMRPALVVLGLAVVILLLFGITAVVTGSDAPPKAPSSRPVAVAGTWLRAVPADTSLAPIVNAGSPPANIVDSLTVPQAAKALVPTNNAQGDGQYDQQMAYRVAASQAAVIAFYRSELSRSGWAIASDGAAYGETGTEVLAKKGGTDGWEWEAGVVISPTTFGHGAQESTPFVLRLFQIPDAN
jgi:hypothetical protein